MSRCTAAGGVSKPSLRILSWSSSSTSECDGPVMMMIFRSNYIYSVQTCSFGSAPKILSYLLSHGIAYIFDTFTTSHCPSLCAGQLRESSRYREQGISVNGYQFPSVYIETTKGYRFGQCSSLLRSGYRSGASLPSISYHLLIIGSASPYHLPSHRLSAVKARYL